MDRGKMEYRVFRSPTTLPCMTICDVEGFDVAGTVPWNSDGVSPNHCNEIPMVAEREANCREPWMIDDGVPYCCTCGLYRDTISRQMHNEAREKRLKRHRTHKSASGTHK